MRPPWSNARNACTSHHPAPCWLVWPPVPRAPNPALPALPQIQPIAPIVPIGGPTGVWVRGAAETPTARTAIHGWKALHTEQGVMPEMRRTARVARPRCVRLPLS
eukprot:2962843-Prymnesium_polylepis.1